jgi:L-histidine Nalpha-methyltransferase
MELARHKLKAPVPPSAGETAAQIASVVARGLTAARKSLPPWLLYDDAGSALFEQITELPEYYLTRTERALLAEHAAAMVAAASRSAPPPLSLVELGAGSAVKTRLLLEALLAHQGRASYFPVDVSPSLEQVAAGLRRRFCGLEVTPVSARYPEQLGWLRAVARRRWVLFLGSSIGNYERPEAVALLRAVRAELAPGDALLLGTDLVKPEAVLVPAYDDAAGVTARFNKNILARLNRELDAEFEPDAFSHHVRWNADESRMELYLRSDVDQLVHIGALRLTVRFARGELLHTENSHKFDLDDVRAMLAEAGFALETSWTDAQSWFALHLCRA